MKIIIHLTALHSFARGVKYTAINFYFLQFLHDVKNFNKIKIYRSLPLAKALDQTRK